MNIGFDAKRYFHNPTGLGNYSRTLVNGLAHFYPQHQYFLYNPKPSKRFAVPSGLPINEVLPKGWINRKFSSLWRSNRVTKDLVAQGIQLYHGLSHEIPVGISKTGIPSIVSVHDLIFERYPAQYGAFDVRMHRKKIQYACQHADKVIAISQQTLQDLVNIYNVPAQKIEVCYQSCDPVFAQPASAAVMEGVRKAYDLPQEFFLYVGSLIERKNLLGICKGLKLMQDRLKQPLVVVGTGGSYAAKVLDFVAANGLQNRVLFISERQNVTAEFDLQHTKNLAALYQMATCFIYPSFFEGFGIPVLEALMSQTPVITSSVSCMPETAGEGALYVDPANAEEMGNALVQLQNDADLRQALVQKGSVQAQKFTWQQSINSVMAVYKNLLQDGTF